jgi:hypothetical protein
MVRDRIHRGEQPGESLARLEASVADLLRLKPAASEAHQPALRQLFEALQAAQRDGTSWLETVGLPELEALARARRGASEYRRRSGPAPESG